MKKTFDFHSRFRILKGGKISLLVSAILGSTTLTFAAPTGGTVTSGSATINQSGTVTNINQSTNKATINWQNFSISSNETVNFNQPNSSSITLNRVIGTEKSVINGALNANGQVWILNSNGVLFGKNASINTSGLLATTAELSDNDFNAGNYNFKNATANSIINEGTIEVVNNGSVVLASNEVANEGTIKAVKGNIHLVGANSYSINLNGNSLVNLTVDKGVLDALVKNLGNIIADGGEIYLTTNAVNELLKGVVNNTGIIEANSLDGITGKVELFAHGGEVQVGGIIKAKDGFVETSGKDFKFNSAKIEAAEWLIDPINITIDSTLASAIETALGSGNVTISTDGTNTPDTSSGESGSEGNINVDSAISWSANNTLTLSAYNNIYVNDNITHTGTSLGGIIFLYGQGTADGGTSTYSVASGKTVISPSIQWRKGSDLASTRYAIMDGNVFLGGKYIELGINGTKGVFGSSGTAIPSLFFGRQGSNTRIGMIGDADGFGTGTDLRIDYFLPGSDYENYRAFFNSSSVAGYTSEFDNVTVELLSLGADNTLTARVTSMEGDLKVVQDITFKTEDKYFNNSVVLTNTGSSDMINVAFAREFDPDNNADVGGGSSTIQTIQSTISSDNVAVLSGQGLAGDAYAILAGSQSNILFYSADTRTELAVGSGCCSNVTTYGNPLFVKGYSITGDKAMAIKFNIGTLAANSSSSAISYFTSLDNRDISTIIAELNIKNSVTKPTTTPTNNNENITKVITSIVNTNAIRYEVPKVTLPVIQPQNPVNTIDGNRVNVLSQPLETQPTRIVSMEQLRLNQDTNNPSGNQEIRVPIGDNSIIDLVNGGILLPNGLHQQFFIVENSNNNSEI